MRRSSRPAQSRTTRAPGSRKSGLGTAAVALLALLACAACASAAGEGRSTDAQSIDRGRAPGSFYGVVTRWQSIDDSEGIERMRESGVKTIRFLALWSRVERVRDQYEWTFLDRRLAAVREIGAVPIPFLYGFPRWLLDSLDAPMTHAEGRAEWKQFLRDLVARYGPGGILDESLPDYRPVRRWQIWNEPNIPGTLDVEHPTPADYVRVLRHSARAIHSVDPATKLIAAGLAPGLHGISAVDFITGVFDEYAKRGIEPDFSQVSVHPYASTVGKSIKRLRAFSRAVRGAENGSSYRLLIGEVGWASRGGTDGFLGGTDRSQARRLRRAYRRVYRLRDKLNISAMNWYAWEDGTPGLGCSFCPHTGLLRADGTAKPAWRSFRRLATR